MKKRCKNKLPLAVCFAALIIIIAIMMRSCADKGDEVRCLSEEDASDFLIGYGYEIGECKCDFITLPTDFGTVYTDYNEIQLSQGYDLSDYRGCDVTKYTFDITNYYNTQGELLSNVFATVLVFDEKIIGGDVCYTAVDGFIHGFAKE